MAQQYPIVIVSGELRQLVAADTLRPQALGTNYAGAGASFLRDDGSYQDALIGNLGILSTSHATRLRMEPYDTNATALQSRDQALSTFKNLHLNPIGGAVTVNLLPISYPLIAESMYSQYGGV